MTSYDVTLITPTRDRPVGIRLAQKWMANQDFTGSIQWLIIHDGAVDPPLDIKDDRFSARIVHRKANRREDGPKSLAANLLHALIRVQSNKVLIIEDDDYYHPSHVSDVSNRLDSVALAGSIWQKYYNIKHRMYLVQENIGSSLCSTGFRAHLIEHLQDVCTKAYKGNLPGIDRMFWDGATRAKKDLYNPKSQTCIGIKGLPGKPGIGHGHRPLGNDHHWKYKKDPDGKLLEAWVGKDIAKMYLRLGAK